GAMRTFVTVHCAANVRPTKARAGPVREPPAPGTLAPLPLARNRLGEEFGYQQKEGDASACHRGKNRVDRVNHVAHVLLFRVTLLLCFYFIAVTFQRPLVRFPEVGDVTWAFPHFGNVQVFARTGFLDTKGEQ